MDNPSRILATLDRHLHGTFTLYVYGRSALALGYPDAPAEYHVRWREADELIAIFTSMVSRLRGSSS